MQSVPIYLMYLKYALPLKIRNIIEELIIFGIIYFILQFFVSTFFEVLIIIIAILWIVDDATGSPYKYIIEDGKLTITHVSGSPNTVLVKNYPVNLIDAKYFFLIEGNSNQIIHPNNTKIDDELILVDENDMQLSLFRIDRWSEDPSRRLIDELLKRSMIKYSHSYS